jgi:Phosphodiester glycosidase
LGLRCSERCSYPCCRNAIGESGGIGIRNSRERGGTVSDAGLTLAELIADLGAHQAINLDGGQKALMGRETTRNEAADDGRLGGKEPLVESTTNEST